MELGKLEKFYAVQAKLYDKTRRFFLLDRKEAVDSLQAKEGEMIFDFACGTGLNIPLLLDLGARVKGIDYSTSLLNVAKKNYPTATFLQENIATFDLREKADGIICTYALSMVEDWQQSILNMKNHLKKNGRIVILDFHHRWQGFFSFIYPLFYWWLGRHEVYPDKEIVSFLNQHFTDVQTQVRHHGYDFIIIAKNSN